MAHVVQDHALVIFVAVDPVGTLLGLAQGFLDKAEETLFQ